MCLGVIAMLFSSCKKNETYAKQKEKERDAIRAFIKSSPLHLYDLEGNVLLYDTLAIQTISEEQFEKQGYQTYTALNQYVLFPRTGVYMQIVRPGVGEKLKEGESKRIICRYWEYNIQAGRMLSTNRILYYTSSPDVINASNSYGTISASFDINYGGAMYATYGSVAVPQGWLVPLSYVKIGRQKTEDEGIAKVRLIVPHSQGQSDATSYVYPCFYEITFEEMRN